MKDKVIIITGASSGIGEALAINLASKGARVVLAARNIEKLKNTEKVIIAKGTTALSVETDVSKEEDCRRLIEITVKHFGRIDILINNAGISMRAAFNELDSKVIHKLMDVNFWGTFYCSKFAYPYLLASKGSLIAVSSIAGYKGLPGRTGYSASKFAIHGLFDVLRIEALKTGLHIMLACPGYTATNIRYNALTKDGSQQGASPLAEAQLMSADAVAEKIIKGIIKRKRAVIMTFEGKATVFLNKFFPSLVDRLVFNKVSREPDSPVK